METVLGMDIETLRTQLPGPEVISLGIIFVLFLLPRIFIRFGIPFAITSFFLGFASSPLMRADLLETDVIRIFSFLGITSLFLFAGLEVDEAELRGNRKVLGVHLVVRTALNVISALLLSRYLGIGFDQAALLSLAIMTPSTGFILSSIEHSPLPESVKDWVRSKAIAAELVALLFMFVLVNSKDPMSLALSTLVLLILIVGLPILFNLFKRKIATVAPQSEFGFLLLTSLTFALVTKNIGAYYLVGAFIVGLVARRIAPQHPGLSSHSLLRSLKIFTSFFVPFYFFYSGSKLELSMISQEALIVGSLLVLIFVPVRVLSVLIHRKISLREGLRESFPVAVFLLPNLVFGLVIVDILREFALVPEYVLGGIIIYTLAVTLIPSLALKFLGKDPYMYELASKSGSSSDY